MNSYKFWQESIEGLEPKMYVDDPRLGFYRRGVYERDAKGNNRRVGWTPVAIFIDDANNLTAAVGAKYVTDRDQINELWSYVAANPISEEWYRAVAERNEPWPDAHDPSKNRVVEIDGGKGVLTTDPRYVTTVTEESTEQKLIAEINQAKAGVTQYDKIDSDEMAGRALSLKNEITTLAGKLDKIREGLVRPHVDAQAEINGKYNPIIKGAKVQSDILRVRIGNWEDWKRDQARKDQIEAERKAREHAEAARKAEEAGKPAPEAPPPVVPNAPAPKAQIAAAVGRKASVTVKKFVVSIDIDKTFAFFREKPELQQFLLQMAQRSVDAGITVPDAIVEERSVVK